MELSVVLPDPKDPINDSIRLSALAEQISLCAEMLTRDLYDSRFTGWKLPGRRLMVSSGHLTDTVGATVDIRLDGIPAGPAEILREMADLSFAIIVGGLRGGRARVFDEVIGLREWIASNIGPADRLEVSLKGSFILGDEGDH